MTKIQISTRPSFAKGLQISTELLLFGICTFFTAVFSLPFWRGSSSFLGTLAFDMVRDLFLIGVVITCLHFLILLPFINRYTLKPMLSLLIIAGASASYFSWYYGTYFDVSMVNNVLQTDFRESTELLTSHYLLFMLALTLLPLIVLNTAIVTPFALLVTIKRRLVSALVVAAFMVVALGVSFQSFAGLMRNHTELRYLINPGNLLLSVPRAIANSVNGSIIDKVEIGMDATTTQSTTSAKPRLLILVVGETVRAANWGLSGYDRNTTPNLANQKNLVNFTDVTSCGTSTAVSLPCMFADVTKTEYSSVYGLAHKSLLSVVKFAGYTVEWIDNQSGCKGVCEAIDTDNIDPLRFVDLCPDGHCFDEVLSSNLTEELAETPRNELIVFHMLGSHGPSYFRRYPEAFEVFTPTCHKDELSQCSQQEIINGYDNSVRYTDHVLNAMLTQLQADQTRDIAMIYVSDHGESLGEMGLYLHGLPDMIAPDTQNHVPMVWWLSEGFQKATGISTSCLRHQAAAAVSHDNLFHSILGLLSIQTEIYDPELDIGLRCTA